MSKNQKYFKKEDLDKLDKFIQESLDKYYSVQPWDELYQITGENHKYIISDNSTIPDLVIYNKGFNKLNCFYYPNVKGYKKKVKFPRKFFHIKQKENKNYNPSSKNNNPESKKGDQKEEQEKQFEFKSIPKEIEDKYIKGSKKEENKLVNELNDFLKNENGEELKVQLIKDNEKVQKEKDDTKKNKNKYENNKGNKFSYLNNYNDYMNKMIQNMSFQNLLDRKMGIKNDFTHINNKLFMKNNQIDDKTENTKVNEKNNFSMSMENYDNIFDEVEALDKYILNLEQYMINNMTERFWLVINTKSGLIHKYNNEELYYFLNLVLKTDEYKNYLVYSSKFLDTNIPLNVIFDILKKIFKKEKNE